MAKADLILVKNGQPMTTSLLVAEKFSKGHNFVLKKIDRLSCSKKFHGANFTPSTYIDSRGKGQKSYLLTEAKLVNYVLTGKFQALDRNSLSAIDLDLLTRLQRKNAALIDANTPYQTRKQILTNLAIPKLQQQQ